MSLTFLSRSASRPTSRLTARAGRQHEFFSDLERRQLFNGDLGVEISDNFNPLSFYTAGETITVPVVVRNNFANANPAGTQIRVTVEMIDGSENIVISRTVNAVAPVATDATSTVNVPVPVLAFGDDAMNPGEYSIRASVEFVTGSDEFEDDNVAVEETAVNVRWAFGSFGGRSGLTFRSADSDGTTYSITASTGSGEIFLSGVDGIISSFLQFVPAGPSSAITFTPTGRLAGDAGAEADAFIDLTANIFIQRPNGVPLTVATFGGINAPALNLFGNITDSEVDGFGGPPPWKLTTGPITLRDLEGTFTTNSAGIGAFTARNFAGTFRVGTEFSGSSTGALRFNNIFGNLDGGIPPITPPTLSVSGDVASLTVTEDISSAEIAIQGATGAISFRDLLNSSLSIQNSLASLTGRDVGGTFGVEIDVSGNIGAVSLRNITESSLSFGLSGTTFTSGNIEGSSITYGLTVNSFTAGNIGGEFGVNISINEEGLRFGRSLAMTLGNVTSSLDVEVNGHLTTFSINKWDTPDASKLGPGSVIARSAGSIIVRGVTPAGQTDPNAGRTEGEFFFIGGTGRASTVDSVNINGLFTGQFIAVGSVGTFTARGIDTFDGDLVQPSLVVGGNLRTFTLSNTTAPAAPLQTRAAVWARNITTVTANIGGADSAFEVSAGAQLSTSGLTDLLFPGGTPPTLDDIVSWGSGSIGTLNLNLRATGTADFTGRFTAGINADLFGPNRDAGGLLSFTSAARTVGATTISRIGAINLTGPATTGGNSVQFGFITYPAAPFTYGGTANTRISPTLPANAPGFITSATGFAIPADTFFRLGRPIV